MSTEMFLSCFQKSQRILTEGAVGLRIKNEYGLSPDKHVQYAYLVYDAAGRRALRAIYGEYLQAAQDYNLPILLFTNTRRANRDRVAASSYRDENVMRDYASFLREVAADYDCETYIGGYIGGKGDGYTGADSLPTAEATSFHAWQVAEFENAGVDCIMASLMATLPESIGMVQAIGQSTFPYLFSFMMREDGTLPDGTPIDHAIHTIDSTTSRKPLCYMANCVHPKAVKNALQRNDAAAICGRFMGIQANAAYASPAELDKPSATITTAADMLTAELMALDAEFPLKIIGGCCGTDGAHLRAFAEWLSIKD